MIIPQFEQVRRRPICVFARIRCVES